MRVEVVKPISTARGILPTGKILEISEETFLKLAGKVRALSLPPAHTAAPEPPQATAAPAPIEGHTHCRTKKLKDRICPGEIVTGPTGVKYCSLCFVPAIPAALRPRKRI